jgi:hypothetical protein
MTSARMQYTNRANARASTGPRTGVGKARAARNARIHGLNLTVLADPALSPEVDAWARKIAGEGASPECIALAARIAEAQIDLVRVRHARLDVLTELFAAHDWSEGTKRLVALDRYERRALSRRKFAIREFDDAVIAASRAGDRILAKRSR